MPEEQPTREIIATIEKITTRQTINGKDYLILEIYYDNPIFVFDGKVRPTSWELLQEGKEYNFLVEEGKGSNNLLISFSLNE